MSFNVFLALLRSCYFSFVVYEVWSHTSTTYETGLDFGENGIKISNLDSNNFKKIIIKYKDLNIDDYKKRFIETLNNSMLYTHSQFKYNFKKAILKTID